MKSFNHAVLAAIATVLLSSAGAGAADLYGGSIKDSGAMPPMPTRPAMFYMRGDFIASSNDVGTVMEAPNYTASGVSIGGSRGWGAGVGYYFSPNIRGDLTLDWSNTASLRSSIAAPGATVQGERQFGVKNMVGLANLYYDFDTRTRFTPYLGVGLGFARNTTSAGQVVVSGCDTGIAGAPNCSAAMDGSTRTNAAGALMAGFSAKLADRWSLDAGYRFLYVGDARTGDINITRAVNNPAFPQSTPSVAVNDLYAHQLRVGLRMDLR